MRRYIMLAGLALATAIPSCKSYLTEPSAVLDPNNPSTFTRNQLLAGIEAQVMDEQEGGVAMLVCLWMQQCASNAGRFVQIQANYTLQSLSFDLNFQSLYTGGGLVAVRAAEQSAQDDGDLVYKGVLEVLEAMQVGWGADIWGDIPYSEAAGSNPTPKFDEQMAIYDALQALLDQAIGDLAGAGNGPAAADYLYGGDKAKWTQLAYTLKARFYLHTVEKLGAGQYVLALSAAQKGISAPDNSLLATHGSASSERNLWAQFQLTSFGNDLIAGRVLVDLMKADNDPRLPEYFGKDRTGGYSGFDQPTASGDPVSPVAGSARTNDLVFRQPLVTYEENQLIQAEANVVLNGQAAAQPFLDAVRARVGKPSTPATLQAIMQEKYILMYQNVEAWNDFKRTCIPRLRPANASFTVVPGRLLYGSTEKQTNPDPVLVNEGPLQSFRNANDPNACPTS